MELVIRIDKADYEKIKKTSFVENTDTMLHQSSEDRKGTMILFRIMDAIKDGTPLDSIIADIEVARDKDKLCEYPYNRCIDILRGAADEN